MMSRFLRRLRATGATTPILKRQGNVCFSSSLPRQDPSVDEFDPYEYTSGCWMRDEVAQRQARRVEFNFPMLRQKAVQSCPGAKEVLRCVKVEGNFNRAFIFHLDNGLMVVARIPFSVAGPARLVTNSEVATLAYSASTCLSMEDSDPDCVDSPREYLGACTQGARLE